KSFDNNGGKLYRAKGDSIAVSGGQSIADVTPNCTVGSAVVGVNSVTISGNGVANGKLSIMAGKSVQLNAAVLPENATNKTVSWTSSNSSVANVMGTGLLTAGKAGTAAITATADGVSSKITVTVTSAPQPSGDIVIAGAESGKVVGNEEFQLTAREKDGSSFENVEWSIPNTDLLKFINGGFSKTSTGRTVNLKAEFSFMRDDYADTVVSVKATRADGTVLTAQKKLSVGGYDSWSNSDPVDSITPSADGLVKTGDDEYTLTMSAGSSKHVDLKVLPSNARQLPLWSKLGGDDSVVTVDGDGTIYAHKAGTFQTSATIYNRYFNLTVVVK
ncbi:Ig-like domain-containing protein, partial [Bifidobacterium adolescentis]